MSEVSVLRRLTVDEYLQALLPSELPESLDNNDNAIKQRTVIVFGRQESGKSNVARILVQEVKDIYGAKNVGVQWFQAEEFRSALESKWPKKPVIVLVIEDITDVKLTDADAKEFFRIRHIMAQRTGNLEGLCVCIFTLHRFHDMPTSFRSDYDSLIALSLPMNDYDFNFIESKITQEGVKRLEEAEAREAHGVAVVSVRRHLLGLVSFPRYVREKRTVRGFLEKLKFWA
jgi:hypothetical protein